MELTVFFMKFCFWQEDECFRPGRTFPGGLGPNAWDDLCITSQTLLPSKQTTQPPEILAKFAKNQTNYKKSLQNLLLIPKYRAKQIPNYFCGSGNGVYCKI